jgi:hypothetical protein
MDFVKKVHFHKLNSITGRKSLYCRKIIRAAGTAFRRFFLRSIGGGRGARKRRSGLLLFGFLDLDADVLADFFDVL